MAQAGTGGIGAAGSSGEAPGGGAGRAGAGPNGAGANGGVVIAGAAGLGTGGSEGGTGGENNVSGAGGGISPDFCPAMHPVNGLSCGLTYNDPDAVCVYGDETCRCFSADLMHVPPLWNCTVTAPAD